MFSCRGISRRFGAPIWLPVVLLLACGGNGSPSEPSAETGAIAVTIQTAAATPAAALDPDGYTAVLSADRRHVDSNGSLTFADLSPGSYEVGLEDLQANCTTPKNPMRVTVVAGGTTRADFQITCWPPTSGRIAFTSNRDGASHIYSMNTDGTDVMRLTFEGGDLWPAWSPDGWRIAFTHAGAGASFEDIYVMNSDGSGRTQLTSSTLPEEAPSWSPDGARIAFSRYPDQAWGPEDIFVVNADGSGNETRLTSHPARDYLPAWSPDGSRIAFTTERDGNPEVYVMNADGSNPVNLTRNPANDIVWAGAWSPDGTKILFQTNRTGDAEIFVMDADGSNPVNLTRSPEQEHGGSWSADGTRVVFSRHPVGNIFVMNADGTGVVDLTRSGAVLDRYPDWSRGTGSLGPVRRTSGRPQAERR